MSGVDALIKQAEAAYRGGNKDQARALLLNAVEQDEQNEQIWWWLSAVVPSLEEQQICLENVLALNPANAKAQRGLEMINQQVAARGKQAKPASGDPAWFGGAPGTPPIGAEYGEVSGDSLVDSLSDVQVKPGVRSDSNPPTSTDNRFESWLSSTEGGESRSGTTWTPDPSAPATSVEWGRGDKPAAHGSGKQVDLPSPQEYDDWVHGLNLDQEKRLAAQSGDPVSPFLQHATPPPFNTLSDLIDANLASTEPLAPAARGQGTDPFGELSDALRKPPASPAKRDAASPAPRNDALIEDDPFYEVRMEALEEAFDMDAEEAFDFGDEEPPAVEAAQAKRQPGAAAPAMPESAPAFAVNTAVVETDAYYRYIPKDIEPLRGGRFSTAARLAGIVLLLVLNVLSFGYLILTLMD